MTGNVFIMENSSSLQLCLQQHGLPPFKMCHFRQTTDIFTDPACTRQEATLCHASMQGERRREIGTESTWMGDSYSKNERHTVQDGQESEQQKDTEETEFWKWKGLERDRKRE